MTREERRQAAEKAWQERMDRIMAGLEQRVAQEKLAKQGDTFLASHPQRKGR